MKQRLQQFDILKGIGILLVIIGHTKLPDLGKDIIYGCHMPLFFFCSGVFYKDKPIKAVFVRNFNQLIVPYFFFCLLWNFSNMVLFLHGADFSSYLALLRQNADPFSENGFWYKTIWFLPCLFIVRMLYAVMYKCIKGNIKHIVIGGVVYLIGNQCINATFFIDTAFSVYLYYVMGNVFFTTGLFKNKLSVLHTLILLMIYITFICLFRPDVNLKNNIFPVYLFVIALIGIYAFYQISFLIMKSHNFFVRFLLQCGESSLTLLGLHRPIWIFINPICKSIISAASVLFLVQIISALVITLPVHKFLSRYAPRLIGK